MANVKVGAERSNPCGVYSGCFGGCHGSIVTNGGNPGNSVGTFFRAIAAVGVRRILLDDIVAALRCDDDQFDFGLRLLYSGASLRASSEEHSDE